MRCKAKCTRSLGYHNIGIDEKRIAFVGSFNVSDYLALQSYTFLQWSYLFILFSWEFLKACLQYFFFRKVICFCFFLWDYLKAWSSLKSTEWSQIVSEKGFHLLWPQPLKATVLFWVLVISRKEQSVPVITSTVLMDAIQLSLKAILVVSFELRSGRKCFLILWDNKLWRQ